MGLASEFIKKTLKKPELVEKTIKGKLGQSLTGKASGLPSVKFKVNKIHGAVMSGIELDMEFEVGGNKYTYKGREDFTATKNGKTVDPTANDKDLKGASVDMTASDLIMAYAVACGATVGEMEDLIDNSSGEFKKGDIVFEATRPSQQADDEETAELAKLMVEQNKLLDSVLQSMVQTHKLAVTYNSWLEKNKVQALMGDKATKLAKNIQDLLKAVQDIV